MRGTRYWPFFWASGNRHSIDPILLAAICDAETEFGESRFLDKKGPSGRGDGGHGHGLMQVDDRPHKSFIQKCGVDGSPLWALPEENIEYATAHVLSPAMGAFANDWPAAIGAYNAGVYAVHKALTDLGLFAGPAARFSAINGVTARRNYVTRVLVRFRAFGGEAPWLAPVLEEKWRGKPS